MNSSAVRPPVWLLLIICLYICCRNMYWNSSFSFETDILPTFYILSLWWWERPSGTGGSLLWGMTRNKVYYDVSELTYKCINAKKKVKNTKGDCQKCFIKLTVVTITTVKSKERECSRLRSCFNWSSIVCIVSRSIVHLSPEMNVTKQTCKWMCPLTV